MSRIAPARRIAARVGLATLSSLALSAGVLTAVTAAAQAANPNPYSPAYQHPYRHGAVPTRETQQQIRSWAASHGQSSSIFATGSGQLKYGGGVDGIGVTTGKPKVYLVFYGSQWGTAGTDGNGNTTLSGDSVGMAPRLQQLFKGIGTSSEQWSGVMTQYCEGVSAGATSCPGSAAHVGYPTGGALAGVWYDNSTASPSSATGHQLGVEAVKAAGHFGNTTATSNRSAEYVILSPHGTTPDGFNTPNGGFCAWHDWNGDTTMSGGAVSSSYGDIAFTNMPYVTDAGTSCGQNFVNSGSAGTLDGVTMVEGHEYAETITDQNPAGGWTDSTGYENADKCAWISSGTGASANVSFSTGTFAMQTTWSNDVSGCQMYHAIVGGTTNDFTMSVSPTSGSVTAGNSTTATVSTTTSSGSAQTVTLSASGLPSGATASFSPSSVTSGGSSTMTIATSTSTASGTYPITITGTGSSATHSTTYSLTVSGSSGGCTGSGQQLGNPGFESGNTIWSSTSGVIGQYGSSGEPTHSGTWNAWLDGYGSSHTDTLSQSVTLPAGCSTYTFSFWLHIDTAETTTSTAYDKLTVQVGSTTLATYSNLNKNSGYVQKSFNLASYAGQTVTLKFTGTEDSSLQTSFVIDDTAVNVS